MSALSPRHAPKTLMRLADIEDALASGKSEGRVMHEMHERHGIQARQCRRLMALARARWAREASAAGREQRRNQLRTAAWTTYRAAMKREGMALDKEGGEHFYANPDAGAAVRALEFVARLDGDLTQPDTKVQLMFGDATLKELYKHYYGDEPIELPPATLASGEPTGGKGG